VFSLTKLRAAGSPLRSIGGRVVGPTLLPKIMDTAVRVFSAAGKKSEPCALHGELALGLPGVSRLET